MHTSNTRIDFKALRAALDFASILGHYKVAVPAGSTQYKGPCPLPGHGQDRSKPTFSAELSRGIFQCFACKAKGNVLEFAALMEGVNPEDGRGMRKIAMQLQEAFCGTPKTAQSKLQPKRVTAPAPAPVRVVAVNAPLDFELKGLHPDHAYLQGRGITGETARFFGIGVTDRGSLKDRLAIPLHDPSGRLIGYAGRILNDSAIRADNPKYLFPERRERHGAVHEFRKGDLVYNAHRIGGRIDDLIVVEGFTAVWWLHQSGCQNAVATMGGECSDQQAATIAGLLKPRGRAWVITGSAPSILAAEQASLATIASHCSCRWVREFRNLRLLDLTADDICRTFKR